MPKHTPEELTQWAALNRRFLESFIYMDLVEVMPPKKAGEVRLILSLEDGDIFTNNKIIHLGLQALEESDDLLTDAIYFLGHELQHIHSTTQRDWLFGQSRAMSTLWELIAKRVLGHPVRLINFDRDSKLLSKQLAEKGVYLPPSKLHEIVHRVLNSLEDGRIEGIRHHLYPGFTTCTRQYRRKQWEKTPIDVDVPLSSSEKLRVVMNQILVMSTMQVWQKGFTAMFIDSADDPDGIYSFCTDLIPLIAEAISAKTCRKCMDVGVKVCTKLVDLIIDTAKESNAAIEQLLNLLKEAAEGDYSFGNGIKHDGSGDMPEPIFGHSVLVVELEDDEYDKMMENASNKQQDGPPSVIFKRKHPKPEATSDSESEPGDTNQTAQNSDPDSDGKSQSASGSECNTNGTDGTTSNSGNANQMDQGGSGSGEATSREIDGGSSEVNGSNGSNTKPTPESAGTSESGTSGTSKGSDATETSEAGTGSNPGADAESNASTTTAGTASSGKGGSDSSEGTDDAAATSETDAGSDHGANDDSDTNTTGADTGSVSGDNHLSENELANQIAEAAKESEAELKPMRDAAKQSEREVKKFASSTLVENNKPSKPFDTSEIVGMYADDGKVTLEEIQRNYTPTAMLPVRLKVRGDSFKRKIEEKLKSKQMPKRRGQKAGSVDASRLSRLAMKQIDCFKKRSKSQKPDCCTYILIDHSGSMWGEKTEYALEASAVVEEGFKSLTPVKITAFDATTDTHVRHNLIKDWEEHGTANLSYNFLLNQSRGSGNKDGYSIRVATHDILTRPEHNKLLLVLSDGMPTEYRNGYEAGIADVKDAVETARKSGVYVVGIFFGYKDDAETFQNMYDGRMSICTRPDKIEEELTRVMSQFFFA